VADNIDSAIKEFLLVRILMGISNSDVSSYAPAYGPEVVLMRGNSLFISCSSKRLKQTSSGRHLLGLVLNMIES